MEDRVSEPLDILRKASLFKGMLVFIAFLHLAST